MSAVLAHAGELLLGGEQKRAPFAHAHRVVPGFTRAMLAQDFAARGFRLEAEIGVADGRFSRVLCDAIPGLDLLCVDPWRRYPGNPRGGPQEQHDRNWDLARERLRGFNVRFVRDMSAAAARDVRDASLDFVFIDGNHQYDYALADLQAWAPKVRRGGIVSGHDLYHFPRRPAGVVEAVEAFTREHDITDWSICDEREPSFWWVQRA